nr:MAG TPA: hypothetical protein [Caudoviricetes sp.]
MPYRLHVGYKAGYTRSQKNMGLINSNILTIVLQICDLVTFRKS